MAASTSGRRSSGWRRGSAVHQSSGSAVCAVHVQVCDRSFEGMVIHGGPFPERRRRQEVMAVRAENMQGIRLRPE